AAGSEDAAAAIAPGRDAAHGGEMFVVRAVLGRRDGAGAAEVRGSEEPHQPAPLRVREGLQQKTAHDAEDARGRADGEREREDDDGAEPRASRQESQCAPKILPQAVHGGGRSEIHATTLPRRQMRGTSGNGKARPRYGTATRGSVHATWLQTRSRSSSAPSAIRPSAGGRPRSSSTSSPASPAWSSCRPVAASRFATRCLRCASRAWHSSYLRSSR